MGPQSTTQPASLSPCPPSKPQLSKCLLSCHHSPYCSSGFGTRKGLFSKASQVYTPPSSPARAPIHLPEGRGIEVGLSTAPRPSWGKAQPAGGLILSNRVPVAGHRPQARHQGLVLRPGGSAGGTEDFAGPCARSASEEGRETEPSSLLLTLRHTVAPLPSMLTRTCHRVGAMSTGLTSCLSPPLPPPWAHRSCVACSREAPRGHGPGSRALPGLRLAVTRPRHRPSPGLSSPWGTTEGAGGSGAETPVLRAWRAAGGRGARGDRPPPSPPPRSAPSSPPLPTPRARAPRAAARDPLTMAGAAQVRTRSSSRWPRGGGTAPGARGRGRGGAERTRPPVIVNSAATRALGLCPLPALSSGLLFPGAQGLRTRAPGADFCV